MSSVNRLPEVPKCGKIGRLVWFFNPEARSDIVDANCQASGIGAQPSPTPCSLYAKGS
jgi:hypothetical protein